jgi:hypothetical protein
MGSGRGGNGLTGKTGESSSSSPPSHKLPAGFARPELSGGLGIGTVGKGRGPVAEEEVIFEGRIAVPGSMSMKSLMASGFGVNIGNTGSSL